MNDTAISILILLLVFGFCFIAAMVYFILPKRPRPMAVYNRSSDRSAWGAGILAAIALFAIWSLTGADERRVRLAESAPIAKPKPSQIVTLADCPRPGPGLTDTIVMVIKSQADLQPTVTGCSRIAERPQRKFRGRPVIAEAK
jgi:hypothetical protein